MEELGRDQAGAKIYIGNRVCDDFFGEGDVTGITGIRDRATTSRREIHSAEGTPTMVPYLVTLTYQQIW